MIKQLLGAAFPLAMLLSVAADANATTVTLAKFITGDTVLTNKAVAITDFSATLATRNWSGGNFRTVFTKAFPYETVKDGTGNNWLSQNMDKVASSPSSFAEATNSYVEISLSAINTSGFNLTALSFDMLFSNDASSGTDKVGVDYGISLSTNGGTTFTRLVTTPATLKDSNPSEMLWSATGKATFYSGSILVDLTDYDDLTNAVVRIELYKRNSSKPNGFGDYTSNTRGMGVSNIVLTGEVIQIPEPSTYALFGGIAAAGVALAVRRRRKA